MAKLKEFDQKIFEGLCSIMCTEEEICYLFDCCEDTLNSWCKRIYKKTFSEAHKKFSAGGKISLRRAQFQLAKKSTAMAIFLGKQYLGQKDVVDVNTDVNVNETNVTMQIESVSVVTIKQMLATMDKLESQEFLARAGVKTEKELYALGANKLLEIIDKENQK